MLREWLQIARSQTAAAVIMLCGVFFLLGGGNLFSWYGLAVILFAIIIHDCSFAHNSVVDFLTGYDTKDRFKKHFPLCNGRFDSFLALKTVHIGLFFSTVFATVLAYFGSGNPFLAMSCFSFFLMTGFWYNEWTSKIALWDFFTISLCFTSLSLYSYFIVSGEINSLVVFSAVYIFLVEWYEIGIAGEIKELEMKEEKSLLRYLGMTYDKKTKVFDMHNVVLYPWALKMSSLIVIMLIINQYAFTYGTVFIFMIFTMLILYFNIRLTEKQVRNRNRALKDMACGEILAIFFLPLVLYPLIGLLQAVFLIVLSLGYFLIMNKINWGTVIRPRV